MLAIVISGLISIILANAWLNFGAIELGAIYNFIIPLSVLFVSIILFRILNSSGSKNIKAWIIVLCGVNILAGLILRLDFYYNFLNL